jgi:hypothetical protein
MAGFVQKEKKYCVKITGLPNEDKIERLVYVSLSQSVINVPVKAVRRIISTEYESFFESANIYVYLHRGDSYYVDQIVRRINASEFEFENRRRYAVEARQQEEKEFPREYMGLQRDQGVTVKLTIAGGLNIQNQFYFGLNDVQPNIETPTPLEQLQLRQQQPAQTQSLPAHIQSPPSAQPQSLPDNKDEPESTERFETDDQLNSGDDSDSDNSFTTVVPNKPRPQQTDNYSSNINNIFFSLALPAIYNSNSSKIKFFLKFFFIFSQVGDDSFCGMGALVTREQHSLLADTNQEHQPPPINAIVTATHTYTLTPFIESSLL